MAVTPAPAQLQATGDADALVEGIIAGFRSAWRELRCVASERMLRQGLSVGLLHAMIALDRRGEMPMSGLADALDVSLSNATGLVDRLAERGLVERYGVPDDRRVVMVRMTDLGRGTLADADVLKEELLRSVLISLDARRLQRIAAALDDMREAVDRLVATSAASDAVDHPHRHGHAHGGDRRPQTPA